MSETIDITPEVTATTTALQKREPPAAGLPAVTENKPQVTAAQAKVEAVANLTFKAYERASTLALTPDEIKGLGADFPDEAFKPGAAGKEHLIYIEHAFLRDRLNSVIGVGQWALIPRNRWAEDFTTNNGKPASRVYVEAMLVVRGAFVSEAVGEMEYYPNNSSQNYGDAVEGAKTAALRRCCKEFGIGLQAWKKDWCEGWWQRKRTTGNKPPVTVSHPALRKQPPPPEKMPTEAQTFPVCTVTAVKEVHSKPDAPKKWTAFFIMFNDGVGDMEAATFDSKIAAFARSVLETHDSVKLTAKPGRKPGSREIISLDYSDPPPTAAAEDDVPMNFDEHGQPIQETIP